MGFSDSPMFLSEKDSRSPKQMHLDHNSLDFYDDAKNIQEKEIKSEGMAITSLKLELPAMAAGITSHHEEDQDDGSCKTPTSDDHKIPPTLVCPPAPKKGAGKWLLPAMPKLKASRRKVFLDMSKEIEALFPPAMLADFGNKIKKVSKQSIIK